MKWLLIALVVIFVVLGSIIPITGYMISKGLDNPTKSWAPGLTQKGVRIRMIFGNYDGAAQIWQQAAMTWPDHPDCPIMVYRVAFCLEKAKQPEQAMVWYGKYLAAYPKHRWADQARRRLQTLQGGEG